ncbi:MAG: class I SAM-dependent methyltransferase [Candidatus Thermoplasmatota archaeon]|nr:class I SAM-dependent methyltransferase [Candidatus Thermoplasmatota archaeon]
MNDITSLRISTLEKLIRDRKFRDSFNESVDRAIVFIDSGFSGKKLLESLNAGASISQQIVEIAKARVSSRVRFSGWNRIWLDRFSSKYATPEEISRYRSRRITDSEILDIGSGSGLQAIFLSLSGRNKVTGIERDPVRFYLSILNSIEMEASEVSFKMGDFFRVDLSTFIKKDMVVYSDPLRIPGPGHKEIDSLVPSPVKVMQKFSDITKNFCFDLPPTLSPSEVGISGEKEYISVNHTLKRLTLYTGDLRKSETSAVLLPEGREFRGMPDDQELAISEPSSYIYVADPAIVRAGLIQAILKGGESKVIHSDHRRTILSSSVMESDFPGETYQVIGRCDKDRAKELLINSDAGKVILRYSLNSEEYYGLRENFERGLTGSKTVYIFEVKGLLLLAEKL